MNLSESRREGPGFSALLFCCKLIFIFSLFLLPSLQGCSGSVKKSEVGDYITEGFISENSFQIIVKAEPDLSAHGIVARRDSAYIKARKELWNKAKNALLDYCVNEKINQNSKLSKNPAEIDRIKAFYDTELIRFKNTGKIAAEYYLDDSSVVIVYRITVPGMKRSIDALYINTETK